MRWSIRRRKEKEEKKEEEQEEKEVKEEQEEKKKEEQDGIVNVCGGRRSSGKASLSGPYCTLCTTRIVSCLWVFKIYREKKKWIDDVATWSIQE